MKEDEETGQKKTVTKKVSNCLLLGCFFIFFYLSSVLIPEEEGGYWSENVSNFLSYFWHVSSSCVYFSSGSFSSDSHFWIPDGKIPIKTWYTVFLLLCVCMFCLLLGSMLYVFLVFLLLVLSHQLFSLKTTSFHFSAPSDLHAPITQGSKKKNTKKTPPKHTATTSNRSVCHAADYDI